MVPCQVAAVSPARGRLLLMPQPALTSGREASTGFLFVLYTLTAKELDLLVVNLGLIHGHYEST